MQRRRPLCLQHTPASMIVHAPLLLASCLTPNQPHCPLTAPLYLRSPTPQSPPSGLSAFTGALCLCLAPRRSEPLRARLLQVCMPLTPFLPLTPSCNVHIYFFIYYYLFIFLLNSICIYIFLIFKNVLQ